MKKDLIVFESNVGKLVGDSPKFIYDELKKYNKKYQIVWATNTLYPFNDPNVKTVKRLSRNISITYLERNIDKQSKLPTLSKKT